MKWKELEDYDWFPPLLRKYQMQNIGIQVEIIGLYRKVVPIIDQMLAEQHLHQITDLCSGSGLPAQYISKRLSREPIKWTLTDKYPQSLDPSGSPSEIVALNIFDLEPQADTLYTMFNAFHHFDTAEQVALMQKIKDNRASILIVEILKPNLWNLLLITLASTLGVWVFFWWIRPFEWRRLLLTYCLPVNVLTVWLDGMISILKSKTAKTYKNSLKSVFSEPIDGLEVYEMSAFPSTLTIIKYTPDHA